jgi:integrase
MGNVLGLTWREVDLESRTAFFAADDMKNDFPLGVALNDTAMEVVRAERGKHETYVFSVRGGPIKQANGQVWRNALKRAGITDFRFHDCRHTWASMLVQNGATMAELQEAGGWKTGAMVRKYAHLSKDNLQAMAGKLDSILYNSCTVA